MAFDLYQHVTDTIIANLEVGAPAWRKPWTDGTAAAVFPRCANGDPYRGIVFLSDQVVRGPGAESPRSYPSRGQGILLVVASCGATRTMTYRGRQNDRLSEGMRKVKLIVTASSGQTRKRAKRTTIPWRTLRAGEVALAPDVAHRLAQRFGISEFIMEWICRHLDRMLRDDWLEFHEYEMHIIRSQLPGWDVFQTVMEEQAARIFGSSVDQLKKQADDLARTHRELQTLALESTYHQVIDFPQFEELKDRIKEIQAELNCLPEKITQLREVGTEEGIWIVPPKSRRGKERDPRRVYLIAVIFNCTKSADEELTYSTDALTNERRGPFVEFFNAILQEVTEPPTTISGNTIVADLRRRRRGSSR